MSDQSHTPGPWETSFRLGARTLVQTPGQYPIAITDMLPRAARVQAEQEANARLIAAAPDLLDQHECEFSDLQFLLRAIEEDDPKSELIVRVKDMIKHEAAAIAKATGESQ